MPSPGLPPTAILILVLLSALKISQAQNLTWPLKVCSFQDSIFIRRCEVGDLKSFTGYDTELWRLATARMGLVEGHHYIFRCVPLLTDVIADLKSGVCDVGLGSVTISHERVMDGILFSRSIHATSLGVLVPAKVSNSDGFFMIRPFDGWVWLAFGLTILLVPVLVLSLESVLARDNPGVKHLKHGKRLGRAAKDSLWAATKLGIQNSMVDPAEFSASRMLAISLFLLFMLLMRCWSAGLTAFLTVRQLQSSIKNFLDLRGRTVLTVDVYQFRLERDAIRPTVVPYTTFQGADDPQGWLDLMSSTEASAVVLEREYLDYVDHTSTCQLRLLPDYTLEQVHWGFGFRNTSVNDDFMHQLDRSILALQEVGTLTMLRDKFIESSIPDPSCSFEYQQQQGTSVLNMSELWGIWVIGGVGVLLAFALAAPLWWRRRRRRRARERAGKPTGRSRSSKHYMELNGLESCELESDVLESGKLDSGELGSSVVGSGKLASSSSSSRLERYKLGSGKLKCNGGCEEAAQEEEPGDSEGEEDAELERPSGGRLLRQLQARLAALEQQQQHSDELVQEKLDTILVGLYFPMKQQMGNTYYAINNRVLPHTFQ